MKTVQLKKYSLHDLSGNYCQVTSNSLRGVIKECNNYFKGAQVSEKYNGPSCWNGKTVSKLKTAYTSQNETKR